MDEIWTAARAGFDGGLEVVLLGGPAIWAIAALSVITLALILWKVWRLALLGAWSGGRRSRRAVAHWSAGREAEALSHQTRGRDAQLASAPQRPNAGPAAPAPTGTPAPPRAAAEIGRAHV